MTVQVQQVNRIDAERLRGLLAVCDEMLRLAIARPHRLVALPRTTKTDLGGHGDLVARAMPGFQGLTHQLFTGLLLLTRSVVGPGGVDMAAACVQ